MHVGPSDVVDLIKELGGALVRCGKTTGQALYTGDLVDMGGRLLRVVRRAYVGGGWCAEVEMVDPATLSSG